MRINGLRKNKNNSMWSCTVSKGARKQGSVGRDLNSELLRVTPCNHMVGNILKRHYGVQPDENGDLLLPYLNIFLSSDKIEETFDCSMKLWSASRLEMVCDRQCVRQKIENYTDMFGNPRTRMREVNEPCVIADQELGVQCPRGCTQEGVLTFYIAELAKNGINQLAKMTLKAWTDLEGVNAQLEEIEEIYGSIKSAQIPSEELGNMIPLILGRSIVKIKRPVLEMSGGKPVYSEVNGKVAKRTGKKTEATHWAISISVRPDFALKFSAFQTLILQKQLGYEPSLNLLEKAGLQPSLAPHTPIEEKSLPLSRLTNEEISILIRANGWTGSSIKAMLENDFLVGAIAEIPDSEYPRFIQKLESKSEAERWISF